MKILVKSTFLISILFLSACSGLSGKAYYLAERETAKSRPAYEKFQEFCSSKERFQINNTANVKGYALLGRNICHRNWPILLEPGYEYYECEKPSNSSSGPDKEKGIYRYSLGWKGDGECLEFSSFSRSIKEKYSDQIKGRCLISRKVKALKSEFGSVYLSGYVDNGEHIYINSQNNNMKLEEEKDLISFTEKKILNLETDETLAVIRNYKYWPEGKVNELVGSYECDEYKELPTESILIRDKD